MPCFLNVPYQGVGLVAITAGEVVLYDNSLLYQQHASTERSTCFPIEQPGPRIVNGKQTDSKRLKQTAANIANRRVMHQEELEYTKIIKRWVG